MYFVRFPKPPEAMPAEVRSMETEVDLYRQTVRHMSATLESLRVSPGRQGTIAPSILAQIPCCGCVWLRVSRLLGACSLVCWAMHTVKAGAHCAQIERDNIRSLRDGAKQALLTCRDAVTAKVCTVHLLDCLPSACLQSASAC